MIRFDDFELDTALFELRRAGERIPVEPQVFDLLVLLAKNHGRTVTKEEIFATIWGNRIVSDAALSSQIKAARRALGDDGTSQRMIFTVHGRGFRFLRPVEQIPQALAESDHNTRPADTPTTVYRGGGSGKAAASFQDHGEQRAENSAGPIQVYALIGSTGSRAPIGEAGSLPLPSKPSIAVLPFDNLGCDRGDDYLADGIVEDIIAALSRVRTFFVIARNSTFIYKGHAVKVQQVSRELGVRYVLEGSLRRIGDRMRVTSQLIDATTEAHLWADHIDGTVEDVFDLQDRITENVVGAIEPSIRAAEIERARRKRPENLDAYDLVMRALPFVWSLDQASNRAATELLNDALKHDPAYPLALSLAAWCSGQRVVYGWSSDIEGDKRDTLEKAQLAAELASDDPFVLTALGAGLAITHEFQAASLMIEKALALDPNSAWAWNRSGWLQNYLDDPETAILHFERAIRLSPFDPMIFNSYAGIGAAHFVAGRYEPSVIWSEKACVANPKAIWIYRTLAPAYVFTGRQKEAEASVRKLLTAYPGLTASAAAAAQVFSSKVLDRIAEGLRRAGLPEEGHPAG